MLYLITLRKTNFLNNWKNGDEGVEKGEELRKEQQYQEMVEIRKMARERRKNAIKKDGSRTNKKKVSKKRLINKERFHTGRFLFCPLF